MEKWQLPPGWAWKSLAEVSDINPRRPQIQRSDSAFTSFVPMSGVDEVEGVFKQIESRPYGEVKRGFTFFQESDVVFAKITPSMENGKSAVARGLIDGIGFGTTEFHVFRPKHGVVPEWIHRYIRRVEFRQEAKQHFRGAVGQQRVPQDFLETYPIPVPFPENLAISLELQRRLIARAGAIHAELTEAKSLLQVIRYDTDELLDAVLAEVFSDASTVSWKHHASLGDTVTVEARQVDPTLPENQNLPHIGGDVIVPKECRLLPYKTVAEDKITSSNYLFSPGEVLYSKIRPRLRKAALVDFHGLCSADIYPLRVVHPELQVAFLQWVLVSQRFTDYAEGLSGRARIPKINRDQLYGYHFQFPSGPEQTRIVNYLEVVRDQVLEMRRVQTDQKGQLQDAEQIVLTQIFQGEL